MMVFGDGSQVPEWYGSGLLKTHSDVDSEEFPDPIKCTGFGCNTMIPQKTKRNKIKLCKRCQNEIYRMGLKQ